MVIRRNCPKMYKEFIISPLPLVLWNNWCELRWFIPPSPYSCPNVNKHISPVCGVRWECSIHLTLKLVFLDKHFTGIPRSASQPPCNIPSMGVPQSLNNATLDIRVHINYTQVFFPLSVSPWQFTLSSSAWVPRPCILTSTEDYPSINDR